MTRTAPDLPAARVRPDKHDFDTLTGNTWSVHVGNHADDTTGAIRTPIVMANSYRLPEDPSDIDDPAHAGLVYTREHGANQRGLEEKLARLDHGEAAAVFGTGMAALHAAFFTILDPGDHVIVSDVVYMRVAGLFADVFPRKLGIESTSSTSPTSTPSGPPYDLTPGSCTSTPPSPPRTGHADPMPSHTAFARVDAVATERPFSGRSDKTTPDGSSRPARRMSTPASSSSVVPDHHASEHLAAIGTRDDHPGSQRRRPHSMAPSGGGAR